MADDGFEEVNVLRKDKPDVVFKGKLIAEADSRQEAEASARKSSDRWTELAVYELQSGDWVAISIACSDKAGETDFGDALLIEIDDAPGVDSLTVAEMRARAMQFWGYTWLAKKLAEEAGWDVRERIG